MQTLTEVAYVSRQAIKYAAAFLIFLIVARIVWQVGFSIYRHFFPKPPPPPTVLFGKLPKLSFPTQENIPKFSYTLELPEGELPKTPPSVTVYTQTLPQATLVALEEARKIATNLGYTGGEESISASVYRFKKKDIPSTLDMNIITGAFSLNYDLNADPKISQTKPPTPQVAASLIRSFLTSANLWPQDLSEAKTFATYYKNEGGTLVLAPSLSDANFVRVDFFRQDYNELPVVTTHPQSSNVWFAVSSASSRDRQLVTGEYHYFPVDKDTSSTYPIKSATVAWEELNAGQAFIIGAPSTQDKIVTRRVYLAYYDNNQPQEFFQPVFVFEGDNNFMAYVPAVAQDYYGKE